MDDTICLIFKPHKYKNYAAVVFSFGFHEDLNRVPACVNYEFQRRESVVGFWLEGAVSYCKLHRMIPLFKKKIKWNNAIDDSCDFAVYLGSRLTGCVSKELLIAENTGFIMLLIIQSIQDNGGKIVDLHKCISSTAWNELTLFMRSLLTADERNDFLGMD